MVNLTIDRCHFQTECLNFAHLHAIKTVLMTPGAGKTEDTHRKVEGRELLIRISMAHNNSRGHSVQISIERKPVLDAYNWRYFAKDNIK